jgi:hypothetical protein
MEGIERGVSEGNISVEKNDNSEKYMYVQVFRQPSRSCFFLFFSYTLIRFSCHTHLLLSRFFSLSLSFFASVFFVYLFFVPSFLSLLLAAMIMMLIDGANMTKTKGATTSIRLVPTFILIDVANN